ncbi:MAG: helix-turn-helix domain-containing protein [bacterium]
MNNTISSRQAASILNVNESTIKRWADTNIIKCVRTAGGHRKFYLEDIRKLAQEQDLRLPVLSVNKDRSKLRRLIRDIDHEKLSEELKRNLLNEDVNGSFVLLYDLYFSNIKTEEIFDKVVRVAMEKIGKGWRENTLTVEQEHIASNTLVSALYQYEKSIVPSRNNGKMAICAGMQNETHAIGLLCVKIFLRHLGYDVVYPGTNLPVRSIFHLMDEYKPAVLCITISTAYKDLQTNSGLKKLAKKSAETGTTLIIGGQTICASSGSPENNFCKTISELSSRLKKKKLE